jgi:hypothetical protein
MGQTEMTRRERLMATLRGEAIDRPPVSFYEINGTEDTENSDPFNIYSHPSWRPLIELARDKTTESSCAGHCSKASRLLLRRSP